MKKKKKKSAKKILGKLNDRSTMVIDDVDTPRIELPIDHMEKDDPDQYQLLLQLCKMALEKAAYEFESLQKIPSNNQQVKLKRLQFNKALAMADYSQPPDPTPLPVTKPLAQVLAERRLAGLRSQQQCGPSTDHIFYIGIDEPRTGAFIELSIYHLEKENPDKYQLVLKLCKMALTHYQEIHTEKTYEFESLQKVSTTLIEYSVTFLVKVCDGTVATFCAVGHKFPGKELKIAIVYQVGVGPPLYVPLRYTQSLKPVPAKRRPRRCNWWRLIWSTDINETGSPYEYPLDLVEKKDSHLYQLFLDICDMALTHYQTIHAEASYVFESLERVLEDAEYTVTFRAKKSDDNTIATFSAVGQSYPAQDLQLVACNKLEVGSGKRSCRARIKLPTKICTFALGGMGILMFRSFLSRNKKRAHFPVK